MMMKKIYIALSIVLLFLLKVSILHSQPTREFIGQIIEQKSGRGVAGLEFIIIGHSGVNITRNDGSFKINVPEDVVKLTLQILSENFNIISPVTGLRTNQTIVPIYRNPEIIHEIYVKSNEEIYVKSNKKVATENNKKLTREGNDTAIFFPIKDYIYWSKLKNPINDANAIADELNDTYGFSTDIKINKSKDEILSVLDDLIDQQFEDNDQLLLYFSGHGFFNEKSKEGFLIPLDGVLKDRFQETYLSLNRLKRYIDNIPCQHIFVIIDACYSGTFDEKIAMKGRPGELSDVEKHIKTILLKKSRLYLTSGGKERTPDGTDHSPLTKNILKALRDFNDDGYLTFAELISTVESTFPTPVYGEFGTNEPNSSFLFIRQ